MCPFSVSFQYQFVPIFCFLSIPVCAHFLFPVNTSLCPFSISYQYQYVPIFCFLSIPVSAHFLFPVSTNMCPFSISCQYQYVPVFYFLSVPICAHFLFPVNTSLCPLFSHTELQPFQNCCCFKFVFATILLQHCERLTIKSLGDGSYLKELRAACVHVSSAGPSRFCGGTDCAVVST